MEGPILLLMLLSFLLAMETVRVFTSTLRQEIKALKTEIDYLKANVQEDSDDDGPYLEDWLEDWLEERVGQNIWYRQSCGDVGETGVLEEVGKDFMVIEPTAKNHGSPHAIPTHTLYAVECHSEE